MQKLVIITLMLLSLGSTVLFAQTREIWVN